MAVQGSYSFSRATRSLINSAEWNLAPMRCQTKASYTIHTFHIYVKYIPDLLVTGIRSRKLILRTTVQILQALNKKISRDRSLPFSIRISLTPETIQTHPSNHESNFIFIASTLSSNFPRTACSNTDD
jgi:hypothetical protein